MSELLERLMSRARDKMSEESLQAEQEQTLRDERIAAITQAYRVRHRRFAGARTKTAEVAGAAAGLLLERGLPLLHHDGSLERISKDAPDYVQSHYQLSQRYQSHQGGWPIRVDLTRGSSAAHYTYYNASILCLHPDGLLDRLDIVPEQYLVSSATHRGEEFCEYGFRAKLKTDDYNAGAHVFLNERAEGFHDTDSMMRAYSEVIGTELSVREDIAKFVLLKTEGR